MPLHFHIHNIHSYHENSYLLLPQPLKESLVYSFGATYQAKLSPIDKRIKLHNKCHWSTIALASCLRLLGYYSIHLYISLVQGCAIRAAMLKTSVLPLFTSLLLSVSIHLLVHLSVCLACLSICISASVSHFH